MKIENTKRMRDALDRYYRAEFHDLNEVYHHHSKAKEQGMFYCRMLCAKHNGEDLRIISWNSHRFTVGFFGTINGKKAFFYVTPTRDTAMYL